MSVLKCCWNINSDRLVYILIAIDQCPCTIHCIALIAHPCVCCSALQNLTQQSSELEQQERMLSIVKEVGARGFILLEPDCHLVLEGGTLSVQTY